MSCQDSFNARCQLTVGKKNYQYISLQKAESNGLHNTSKLPFSLKILLENLLRYEDGVSVTHTHIEALRDWMKTGKSNVEIAYRPARVLMQDFTGVPAIVDLAAMRDAMAVLGGNVEKINPLSNVDLVIDHSVQVDVFAAKEAYAKNTEIEMKRNHERYVFLRWGQKAFDNFRVVPPGTGICHQVNLEYLAKAVWSKEEGNITIAYPDTLVGTDSHTTMINGLGVLGWGVGGIEAEAAMLGQPISMLIPEVIGFKLIGKMREGITATDLVLTITQMLREKGVVDKFVEFFGQGLNELPLPDRATVSNMSPEYGATCGFFPIDQQTIDYLELTGRDAQTIELVKTYCQAQGLWRDTHTLDPVFTDVLELDLSTVEASLAGPKRPQDRVVVSKLQEVIKKTVTEGGKSFKKVKTEAHFELSDGAVVIAAITSCTNTSNPSVLMAAGLLAKNAIEKGLKIRPWVKTSLAPGSKVVTDYLIKAGLQKYLDQLGFSLVGYGCTTCIGNSGPLPEPIAKAITQNNLTVCSVLSGNRNFEGRIHPLTKANFLASPPLVVAYGLAGTANIDLFKDPIGEGRNGPVFLKDIWPSNQQIADEVSKIDGAMFRKEYSEVFEGDNKWKHLSSGEGNTYQWDKHSTYIQQPPFFVDMDRKPLPLGDIENANILAIFGDSVTTDHISPAGSIKEDSPAGKYLKEHGVVVNDFNSYGSRRGNHEVMMRGTFANIRIRNEMLLNIEGGFTHYIPTGQQMTIYDAAMKYQENNVPLVIIAGKDYGMGSSRDWAAKGPSLLGVKVVIAESFERIHRSNLIGMGILPLQFKENVNRKTLKLTGKETISITNLKHLNTDAEITATIKHSNGHCETIKLASRIDTQNELEYYRHGGILHYVIRNLLK